MTKPWEVDPHERPRLSAAWNAMASELVPGDWVSREALISAAVSELDESGCEPLQRQTINAILSDAARDGFLDRWPKNVKKAKRGARKYRVTDEGRRQRPELRVE